ncbi:carbohydrate ABC transporter permease [Paenibacillus doosanensis]|uniref:L-arabinose transport system permease protein AraQ n=1 Tax=Paenibacillus konkukensis TaxID=2020716 RepID=A0ABY4RFY4_9BACL|nr:MULTISPECIES: carbohydrate ABC transporter permease [Paenibacillus]MCS7463994.1 carbohydrate ABC transporter permease [Paenibacillus doosanensis]UQZ81411.1 L-arabinose transport system permease protein AraQ [Paenibacillus konkukensis]
MKEGRIVQAIQYTVLALGAILVLIPMYLTVNLSFKTQMESAQSFFAPPSGLFLGNFAAVMKGKFWIHMGNSVMITLVSMLFIMILVPMVSFAISRNFKRGYFKFVFYFILSGIFVPFQVIMLPVLKHMSSMHLLNQMGLIIMYVALSFTQGIFLSVGFLKNIPLELDEASTIDGCGIVQTFVRIIYPLMLPIIVTIVTLNSLWIWNDFQLPLILLNRSPNYWTLPLFIYNFKTDYGFDYNVAFAGFLITMLPIIVLYGFMQRYLISGLTEGALK